MTRSPFGYMSLITESLRLAWQQKSLWPLGFFLGGASLNINQVVDFDDLSNDGLGIALAIVLLFATLIVAIIFIVVSSIAGGGLIDAGHDLATGRTTSLGAAWNVGTDHWLKILGLNVVSGIGMLPFALMLIGVPLMLGFLVHPVVGLLTGLVTGGLWIVVVAFWVPWFAFAQRHVVLNSSGFREAITFGADLIRSQPLRSAAVSLVRCGYVIAFAIPVGIVSFFALAPALIANEVSTLLGIAVGLALAFPIIALMSSFTGTAGSYFWTMAYLWLDEGRPAVAGEPPSVEPTPVYPPAPPPPIIDSGR